MKKQMIGFATLILIPMVLPLTAMGDVPYGACGGNFECGPEVVSGIDSRVKPEIYQPIPSQPVIGACNEALPPSQAYNARLLPTTCGEGAESRDRLPIAVKKEVMDEWGELSRTGVASDRERMQKLRQVDLKWESTIDFPMFENWTYDQKVGDFSPRCGYEPWVTTCTRTRIEHYIRQVPECVKWEEDAPPVSGVGSGGGSSGRSSGGSSGRSGGEVKNPYKEPLPRSPSKGSDSLKGKATGRYNGALDEGIEIARGIAGRRCLKEVMRDVRDTRSASPVTYTCVSQRPRYCEWYEPRTMTRRCPNHQAKVTVEYKKDQNWKPGYADPSGESRSYIDILPNKFDLLPGEHEEVFTFVNTGIDTALRPAMAFENAWNEYHVEAQPSQVRCEFGMRPEIKLNVHTIGRIKRQSPNPLVVPVDAEGNRLEPLDFSAVTANNGSEGRGKPVRVKLQDKARATMLAAAQQSRTFPRPSNAANADDSAIHKKAATNVENVGDATSNGFWVDTQFKVQLFRRDYLNRWVRMTVPLKFNSNQADIFRDSVEIALDGKDGMEKFYRPAGPLDPVLGGLWKAFGVELTPGENYIIKVQVTQRGLPFYDSGCKGGKNACEGETASSGSYSTPLLIEWTADKNVDQRSWFKRFKDWQEHFVLF